MGYNGHFQNIVKMFTKYLVKVLSYLVICVLVLKSRDLMERKTSIHPRYYQEKEKKDVI